MFARNIAFRNAQDQDLRVPIAAMDMYIDCLEHEDLIRDPGIWAVSAWDPYMEDPSFISVGSVKETNNCSIIDVRFARTSRHHAATGAVFFKKSGLDLCSIKMVSFSIRIKSMANAEGLIARLILDGETAPNAIVALDKSTELDMWHRINITTRNCPELENSPVTLIVEIMPTWDSDMRGVHFQLDHIKFTLLKR